ncbi:MAG: spore germination protein [Ignavibacteriales bacterium]
MIKKNNKNSIINNKIEHLNDNYIKKTISKSLEDNILYMKELFKNDDNFKTRYLENNNSDSLNYCLIYCDGMVNSIVINENIIKPLMLSQYDPSDENIVYNLAQHVLLIDDVKITDKVKDIIENVTYGDTVLFIDGADKVLILNTKQFNLRSMTEPESEKNLIGPREGFNEALLKNLSLIRRRLRTNDLKIKYLTIGEKTNTKVCICYVESVVNKDVLDELYKRISKIEIDGILDTNYISELTRENRRSPFRTTGYTEKPDVVVAKILEGRIAIMVDGTPMVYTIPYLFIENFQNAEDYYLTYYFSSFTRILRIIGFLLTVTLPALYIATVAYHQEMLPSPLLIMVTAERQSVPLPAALELAIMLIVFDILRETGARIPQNVGQSVSVLGAIVIGQAAVEAKLVAAPVIILVAFTGITSLLVQKLNSPIIYARIFLFLLASTLGLFGFIIGISILLIHILNLKSFDISQVNIKGGFKYQENKDIAFRSPWWHMLKRPKILSNNTTRMKSLGDINNGN